jgi:hypothetical protein
MSEESELGVVLANAPKIQKTFGRNWAALITLVSLYFARCQTLLRRLLGIPVVNTFISGAVSGFPVPDRASCRSLFLPVIEISGML